MRIERAACACTALLLAAAAQAQSSPWSLTAGVTFGHEDNLFRAPAGEEIGATWRSVSLAGSLDETLGRQRVQAEVSVRDNRYGDREDLDNTGYGLQLGWNGATAGNISWRLSAGTDRRLASYATVLTAQRRVANLETTRQAVASAQLGLAAQWVAGLTLSHRRLDYSAEAYATDRYELDSVALSATWQPLGPLSASIGPRFTRGRYPQARQAEDGSFQADGFDRHDLDLALNWAASGASTLSARLSVTRQRYTLLSDRDIDGATGLLSWRWQPTGKTNFSAALSRDTGSETSFFDTALLGEVLRGTGDNSTLTTALVLGAEYAASAKLRVALGARYLQRDLAASSRLDIDGEPLDLGSAAGEDRSGQLTLGLRYAPTRNSSIGCDWAHARRAADTTLSSSYRATSVSCSAQLSLR